MLRLQVRSDTESSLVRTLLMVRGHSRELMNRHQDRCTLRTPALLRTRFCHSAAIPSPSLIGNGQKGRPVTERYLAPTPDSEVKSYTCPHCGSFASQPGVNTGAIPNARARVCSSCGDLAIWHRDKLIFPLTSPAPRAVADLPDDVRRDYLEAASIVAMSPRGAAALLRLAVEKLCTQLGGRGRLDDAIGQLTAKGVIPPLVQQALDVVRVIGNNAVHPGQIDLTDDRETAMGLFRLVNLIAEYGISRPKEVSALFDALPQGAKDAIQKRDGVTPGQPSGD